MSNTHYLTPAFWPSRARPVCRLTQWTRRRLCPPPPPSEPEVGGSCPRDDELGPTEQKGRGRRPPRPIHVCQAFLGGHRRLTFHIVPVEVCPQQPRKPAGPG